MRLCKRMQKTTGMPVIYHEMLLYGGGGLGMAGTVSVVIVGYRLYFKNKGKD